MNKCDLEEAKHVALQRFFELAKKPEGWLEGDVYSPTLYRHIFSKFKADGRYGAWSISVNDLHVATSARRPEEEFFATVKSGERTYKQSSRYSLGYWEDTRKFKPLTKAQRTKFEAAKKAYDECPIRIAAESIGAHFEAVANEKRCQKLLAALNPTLQKEEPPYSINNGYTPGPSIWAQIKEWWSKRGNAA
jgi:hypothetical protein